jgi:pantetheine-phosphate adenylyltransferase
MTKTAVFPGTFDPITLGHLDVIERAIALVDHLIVAVAADSSKKTLLNLVERKSCVWSAVDALNEASSRISIVSFDGLLVDYVQSVSADFIIRGMRSPNDFSYEWHMAHMNRSMSEQKLDTIFLMTSPELAHVSSSMVRDIVRHRGDASTFLSKPVYDYLKKLGVSRVPSH